MKERLLNIITTEGLTRALLADKMGVQRTRITHLLSGRNLPSFDSLQKLLINFPKLNAEWLILGHGSMYKSTDTDNRELFSPSETLEKPPICPVIPENPKILSSAEDKQSDFSKTKTEISPSAEAKKAIEKVIVLYADKTFATYFPES